MKNFWNTASVLLLLCFSATDLFSQAELAITNTTPSARFDSTYYDRPNILKTNLAGPFSLLYEARVFPRGSIQLSINRVNFAFLGDQDNYFGLTGAIKIYFSKRASTARRPLPAGFYMSPYLRYLHVDEINSGLFSGTKTSEVKYNLFGGGVTAGYQLIFGKGFTLDFFAGCGYLPLSSSKVVYAYANTYPPEVNTNDYKIDPRLGVCIGYAFR